MVRRPRPRRATRFDERDRRGEVGELEVAHDRRRPRGARRVPAQGRVDLVLRQQCHAQSCPPGRSRLSSSRCGSCRLVPHATELLFALGLGDDVVGVTHECDYPPRPPRLPHVTRDVLPPGLAAGEIDAAVRERTERGEAIYALDERAAARARARPDRHPGAVPGLRRLATTTSRAVAAELPTLPAGHRARPEDVRRDDGRRAHDRPGDRHARRRAGPHRPPAGPRRPRAARRQGRPARPRRRARVARPGLRRRATGRRS